MKRLQTLLLLSAAVLTGAATYAFYGNTATLGTGAGAFTVANCATRSLATGIDIRATANIQQVALRCTPIGSL